MLALAIGTVLLHGYVREQQDRALLHHSFRAYFPPRMVERIERQHQSVTIGGHKKELTVLFSDIENFSSHTAAMAPDHIQALLNEYFEAMTDIVFDHGYTVDKFIGDGLMVFFGDPDPQPDHTARAVRTAIAMQHKVQELHARWKSVGDMPLRIRIGINTGEMVVATWVRHVVSLTRCWALM
jgi:adenylate cyclase